YQAAGEVAMSDMQRAHFTLARERARLGAGEATESQVNTLRQNAERYQGKSVGYAYARQYAALLAARGRTAEAVDFLNKQLQGLPSGERAARDDFRLMLGLVAGVQRAEGRNALEGLLNGATDTMLQRVALQLLARDGADAALFAKLNGWIAMSPAHPILADLLLVRAQLGLAEKLVPLLEKPGAQEPVVQTNQAQAELDAKALLAKFPGSTLKPAALGLLADLLWEQQRYRSAADYAAQARAALPPGDMRASLGVMVAEAFFRAKDYASADEAYAVALREVPPGVSPGVLISQRILAKTLAGRLDEAAALLDEFAGDAQLDLIHRWQSEWTLARDLQGAHRDADAYARVNRLLARTEGGLASAPALRARMAWLQARLSLDADAPRKTLELVAALPALLNGLDAELRSEVEASVRLLQAKAHFRLNEADAALKILSSLRDDFPQSDAAVYSYIDEADYYAENNQFVKAQNQLTQLADKFKGHSYAPYALYRAALNAEQRGEDRFYEEAYRILEGLVKSYPDSKIVFYARLKQGDLARRLNDFPRARLTYEYLINNYNYAQQPAVLSAELALAACHRAQITPTDVSHYESALTILERLQDFPDADIDLRVEAGFQLGDLLATKGKSPEFARAEAVWWTMVTTFLLDDAQAAKLGSKGRYWIARALLRLGDLRRERGDLEEARNAYEIILRKNLPFAKLARETFVRAGGKPQP
ncbi:MAG TPA: tetratricopeptide repeat protein, partial [Rariglobus sp.]